MRCALRSPRGPSSQQQQQQQQHATFYEFRTYCVRPEQNAAFLALTNAQIHLRTAHSELLGYWSVEYGALNQVFHIWKYDEKGRPVYPVNFIISACRARAVSSRRRNATSSPLQCVPHPASRLCRSARCASRGGEMRGPGAGKRTKNHNMAHSR
ncbi:hypothetical protein AAFF_G00303450 [Aldrovandia affinis]|uniref:NIPSNAP domain-containing protein n=1 Tax=Aldrovandia affinis TaxID=143900 RepID=A0AAD7R830_9TELE|nr:hypothetical protein AAFF_G00303450 [Aldrovandia affinis]